MKMSDLGDTVTGTNTDDLEKLAALFAKSDEDAAAVIKAGEDAETDEAIEVVEVKADEPDDEVKADVDAETVEAEVVEVKDDVAADPEAKADEVEEVIEVVEVKADEALLDMMAVPDDETVIESKTEYMCGISRKSVTSGCEFCNGGCAAGDGNIGLKAAEEGALKSMPEGATVHTSGYSDVDDIYVVDVKTADGAFREVFLTGAGGELGWLSVDAEHAGKDGSAEQDIVSLDHAVNVALKSFDGEVVSATVGSFYGSDAYVVGINQHEEAKSLDVYVSVDGAVLGYDEFEGDTASTEEVKELESELLAKVSAMEAEIRIKRTYSQEMRTEFAKDGTAMPDGSFPIVDEADLRNAVQAVGRAADPEAAKAHIIKRAAALQLNDLLPPDWAKPVDPAAKPAAPAAAPADASATGKSLAVEDLELLAELGKELNVDAN